MEESGYAGFLMPIEVYFKNKVRGGPHAPLGNINQPPAARSEPSWSGDAIRSSASFVFPVESL